MNTLLCLTDNTLDPRIAALCQRVLLREANGLPIVSVSQKPVDLGHNVCVGQIGRSWLSFYRQIIAGLDVVETDTVVFCEHDCLYTSEHLTWQPPSLDTFWYNSNCWLVQWGGHHPELIGMYSYWPHRAAFSQLVCGTKALRQSTEEVLGLLDQGLQVSHGLRWHGEPGVMTEKFLQAFVLASSGRPIQLQSLLEEYVHHFQSGWFATTNPNLDVRHGHNFTGPKRGKKRTYELPYWGRFAEVMNG
jgi:hypothetical protein